MLRGSAVVLALALALGPQAARADEGAAKDEARRLLRDGNALLARGEHAAALGKFRAAYAAFASPKILVNVGTALRSLGQEVEAAEVYERCLAEGGSLAASERAQVERALAEIDARVGRVAIEVNEAGAVVLVDGQEAGTSPLARAVRIVPGAHRVEARKEGFHPTWQTVQAEAGKALAVKLLLAHALIEGARAAPAPPLAVAPTAAPAPVPPEAISQRAEPAPRAWRPPPWAPWAALGVAAASAALGAYAGARVLDDEAPVADRKPWATTATVSFVVAGVGAASGAGLWLWTQSGGGDR